jgi:hypothetical protein
MLFRKTQSSTHYNFIFSGAEGKIKTQPMVPEERQIEIGCVPAILYLEMLRSAVASPQCVER